VLLRDGYRCTVCGSSDRLEVHHVDWNRANNDPANLSTRCFAHNPRGRTTHKTPPVGGLRLV
jgi:hypothetical protein